MPFLGLAIDPTRTRFQRGDFLVRGIMALNQRDRSVAVADFVRRGQTVQLLVRDAQSAGEDLRSLLAGSCAPRSPRGSGASAAAGALLFSCNGRGTRMFGKADHDAGCLSDALGDDVPVAGFFAAGEIGPVGGRNFLHGFTASVAVFRGRNPAE
jgi:small ligand-binding sensory domain FIST